MAPLALGGMGFGMAKGVIDARRRSPASCSPRRQPPPMRWQRFGDGSTAKPLRPCGSAEQQLKKARTLPRPSPRRCRQRTRSRRWACGRGRSIQRARPPYSRCDDGGRGFSGKLNVTARHRGLRSSGQLRARRRASEPKLEIGGSKSPTIFGPDVAARTGTNRRTGSPSRATFRGHLRRGFAANLLPHEAENDETEQDELGNPGRAGR